MIFPARRSNSSSPDLLATQNECRYLSGLIGIDSDKQVVFKILSGQLTFPFNC